MKKRFILLFFGTMFYISVALQTAVAGEKLLIIQPKTFSTSSETGIPPYSNVNIGDKDRVLFGWKISDGIKAGVFVKPSVIQDDKSIKMTPGVGLNISLQF